MSLLYILSYVSFVIQIVSATIAIAAGLYYLAELVEEYSVVAKKVISSMIATTTFIYVLFIFFDNLTWPMILCGLAAQIFHCSIMKNFPFISFFSVPFCGTILFLIINHVLAFKFFSSTYYSLSEVLGYFVICQWLVPFALFVSLSANDNVLPTLNDQPLLSDKSDLRGNYTKPNGQGILQVFLSLKDLITGQHNKGL